VLEITNYVIFRISDLSHEIHYTNWMIFNVCFFIIKEQIVTFQHKSPSVRPPQKFTNPTRLLTFVDELFVVLNSNALSYLLLKVSLKPLNNQRHGVSNILKLLFKQNPVRLIQSR
jgi:hypothetical protein